MITLYKGDDTGGQLGKNVKIVFHCDDAVDMDDVVVKFDLLGIVKREFTDVHDGDVLDIFISHAESRKFPLGVIFAKMWGEDASGKLRTFANRIPFRVTLNLIAVYGSDGTDSQDIHVYSSVDWDSIANKPTVFPSSIGEVEGLQEALDEIDEKIPSDASADNQLADKEWVDQEIDRVAAYYITSDAQGNPFQTRAALLNAETYYSGGSPRTPTRNDYAIVLADESHDNTEWRYIYSENDHGVGVWEAQYPVEGAIVADDNVTKTSTNPVKSSGIWSALWGTATTAFSSLYDWVMAQLVHKRDYTDRSYNTQVTVNAPALHAILTSRGTQLLEYYLPCTEVMPATPQINHVYTWRKAGAEFYITQGVSVYSTSWELFNSSGEQLSSVSTDNATQGYFPDLTFATSAYAAVTSTKVNSYPDEVQDALALDSNVPSASTTLPKMDSPNAAVIGTPGKYACSDHVHPTDTSRMAASATGADIAVSGSDATKISAALAGKASKADATLTERFSAWTFSPATIVDKGVVRTLYMGIDPVTGKGFPAFDDAEYGQVHYGESRDLAETTEQIWRGGTSETPDAEDITATRTALPGYQLGSQDDKPLASEAEAEALRQGKQNALTAQQLANIAAVSNALAFDATHTYAAGDPVVYDGTLYTFTATHTGAWTGSDVSAVDIIARLAGKLDKSGGVNLRNDPRVPGSFIIQSTTSGRLKELSFRDDVASGQAWKLVTTGSDPDTEVRIPIGPGALALTAGTGHTGNLAALDASGNPTDAGWTAGDLARYSLATKTIDNGAVTLDDRAMNAVAVSSALASLTINFPTATSGKVRDFGLRLSVASGITTAPELVLPQGVTCENADGTAPEIGADGAATILYFTETAAGVFLVKGEVVTAIS